MVKSQQPIVTTPLVPTKESAAAKALRETPTTSRTTDSPIIGVEGLVYHIAGCCTPIPGEPIIGVVTRGRGISIHRQGCNNLESVEYERLVPVRWNTTAENSARLQTYPVNVQIEALDRVGVLKDILSRLSDQGINVRHAQVKTAIGQPALMDLGIDIRDRPQLEQVFTQIKKMSDILNIRRVGQIDQ